MGAPRSPGRLRKSADRLAAGVRAAALRLVATFRKRAFDARIDEELSFHLEMEERANRARGMGADQARRAARLSLGGLESVKEEHRARRALPFLETLGQDLSYACRMLRKNPGFAAVALLSIGFGVGANVAIFSVVDALLLKTLPVAHADRLLLLQKRTSDDEVEVFSYPSWRRLSSAPADRVCSGVVAVASPSRMLVDPEGGAPPGEDEAPTKGALVSANFFSALGVAPAAGRIFGPAEDPVSPAPPVAVISYGYWQRRFGRAAAAVGRTLRVNGVPVTIVGVAARGFAGVSPDDAADLFLPLGLRDVVRYHGNTYSDGTLRPGAPPWEQPTLHWLELLAVRRPDVSLGRARAVLSTLLQSELRDEAAMVPDADQRRQVLAETLVVEPGARGFAPSRDRLASPLFILLATSALVLLIACANLASLLLARADRRRREMALRMSIGAARRRLLRQLLTESLLLAIAGCGCGVLFAMWAGRFLLILVGGGAPLPLDLTVDARQLAFAAAMALATGIGFGLAPAFQGTRVDLLANLRSGGRSVGDEQGRRQRLPWGRLLVAGQIALSLVLIAGAALFARTLGNLAAVDTGFERRHLLLAIIDPNLRSNDPRRLELLYRRLLEHAEALPGARSASLSLYPLMGDSGRSSILSLPGLTPGPGENMNVLVSLVTPRYFETVGMPLLAGRTLGPGDRAGAPVVAVVNEIAARRYFKASPLGRRFSFADEKERGEYEIVGVVRAAKYNRLSENPKPMIFFAAAQQVEPLHSLELRMNGPVTAATAAALRRALREVDPDLPVLRVLPIGEQLERSLARERALARLTGFFAVLALLLAALGLYGVMSHQVARRTGEIGIRLALGAQRRQVLALVLRSSVQLIGLGAGAGLLAALLATRLASKLLFGVTPHDPATLVLATVMLVAVGLVAGLLPARRAANTDPMVALRSD
jgi:predicted permease